MNVPMKLAVIISLMLPATALSEPKLWTWLNYGAGFVGEPAQRSLEATTENGLILSRLGPQYFSYSFRESRLSREERTNPEGSQSAKTFFLGFHTCNPNALSTSQPDKLLMSGIIYRVSLFSDSKDIDEFLVEFLDIMKNIQKFGGMFETADESGVKFSGEVSLGDFSFLVSPSDQDIRLEISNESLCTPG